ncbi:MAG: helix-turn-helix domain-containing protein [Pleomorphochaeta sp.]
MWEISIIGLSQIVFGIILMLSKKKVKSDYILICWLVILSLPFLESIKTVLNTSWPILTLLVNQSFTLLHGPFLFLYLKELTKEKNEKIKYWPHFIIFAIFYLIFLFNPAPLHPGGPLEKTTTNFSILTHFGLINILIFIIYGIISIRSLYLHRKNIKETFAYKNSEITLLWLLLLPILFVVFIIVIVIIENTSLINLLKIDILHLLLFLFFTLYLIFFGLRQKQVYPKETKENSPPKNDEEKPIEIKEEVKENHDAILSKMDKIMKEEKLYLNPVLSVYDLSDAVNVSRHQISSLLNKDLSMNFYQYVNKYRLEEVCKRLKEDTENKYNIIEHAFDSGFNSKSSFNSLFKTNFNMTPSQYRKSIKRPN